ncbi:hypothetical protein ACFQ6N_29370, partial [Kitasatospora sp. NPDC056446]|uniref:hypothetical protein n=1 Tax=Kitasatospora sp. NPDC056446 TaxID=3345819 RepID=UPI0036C07178
GQRQLAGAASVAFPDAERLADAAAGCPDILDDDTFDWLTAAIFEEESRRRDARLPVPEAVTLPDWAAQDLLELLQQDSAEGAAEEAHSGDWELADPRPGTRA